MANINIEINKACLRNDIAVESALSNFVYETGLADIYSDNVFLESNNDDYIVSPKKKNIFLRAVDKICAAIRRLVDDILDLFNNTIRKDPDYQDYLNSNIVTPHVAYDNEINAINRAIDDEYRKSNKLIQKISSKTGLSDELVDNVLNTGIGKINDILDRPQTKVAIAAGMTKGTMSLMKFLKNVKTDTAKTEADAKKVSDPKRQKQTLKVLKHQNKLSQIASRITASMFSKSKKKSKETGGNTDES